MGDLLLTSLVNYSMSLKRKYDKGLFDATKFRFYMTKIVEWQNNR